MKGPVPIAQLVCFRKEIGLTAARMDAIRPYSAHFAARARKAGKYMDVLLRRMAPRIRMEMAINYFDGAVKAFWTSWYESLWVRQWDEEFLSELWLQGMDAARMGIDLQYMMLGEIKCRQIFSRVVRDLVPAGDRPPVASAMNDLLDLCMMVRAKGHASHRSRIAEPVLQGLFHQTRNPLTVIGASAMRILKRGGDDVKNLAQVILDEALRMERMTRDISLLNLVDTAEPSYKSVPIAELLRRVAEGVGSGPDRPDGLAFAWGLDPAHPEVDTDPSLAEALFKELVVNAVEALPPAERSVGISSAQDANAPTHLAVTIRAPGELPRGQDVEELFLPFNSSRPQGTGMGLPIARAAARKCFGKVSLEQDGPEVACTVKLPLRGQIDASGLLSQVDF
jgi:signal transduction histidine kinase